MSRQLNSKTTRPSHQSSSRLNFMCSMYQKEKASQNYSQENIYRKKTKGKPRLGGGKLNEDEMSGQNR